MNNELNDTLTTLTDFELELIWAGYTECAQWADIPYNEEGTEEVDADEWVFSDALRYAVLDFVIENEEDVMAYADLDSYGFEGVGHNIWLSARGHGTGFWDRGYGALGDRLDKASEHMCGDPYMGDDGIVYVDY